MEHEQTKHGDFIALSEYLYLIHQIVCKVAFYEIEMSNVVEIHWDKMDGKFSSTILL